jgi:ABC-type polysaccharide/polyol phosphate transport system ATPase subunit
MKVNNMIIVDNVSVKYRMAKERKITLQQYVINLLKGKRLNYEVFNALKKYQF